MVAVFVEKPIFLSLKPFFKQRHFSVVKVPKMDSLVDYKELVPQPNVFPVIFASPFIFKFEYFRDIAYKHLGMIMTIRYSFKFPGNKTTQLQTFRQEFEKFGCTLEGMNLMPASFVLHHPDECLNFFSYCERHPDASWVLKPEYGFGGEGITMHGNVDGLWKRFGSCEQHNEAYVVQQYIPDLLLLNNRKFDVRGLLFIASTAPFLLFYHDGYLRVTLKEYSEDLSDLQSHLTNTHSQSQYKFFSLEEHIWTFGRFQKYLEVHHPNKRDFIGSKLVPTIKNYGRFLMGGGQGVWPRLAGTSQVLGLDLMITSNFDIKLIEVNTYPYYPIPSHSTEDFIHKMEEDMFDLLLSLHQNPDPIMAMRIGEYYGSWELVGSEIEERCRNAPPFNPCKDFT
jgi:hypothetical protein